MDQEVSPYQIFHFSRHQMLQVPAHVLSFDPGWPENLYIKGQKGQENNVNLTTLKYNNG